jgi:hypothetical protein
MKEGKFRSGVPILISVYRGCLLIKRIFFQKFSRTVLGCVAEARGWLGGQFGSIPNFPEFQTLIHSHVLDPFVISFLPFMKHYRPRPRDSAMGPRLTISIFTRTNFKVA